MRHLLLLILAAIALIPRQARALDPVILQEGTPVYQLGRHLEYLEDDQGRLVIGDLSSGALDERFVRSSYEVPNFGFTRSAYWFRFALSNRLEHRQKYYLEFYYAVIDRVDFFFERPDGSFLRRTVGDTFPHGNKVMRHNHFVFPVMMESGRTQRIYLRVQTEGAMQAPLKLWTPEAFLDHEHIKQLIYGIFIGLLAVMLFYNLFIFMVVRDTSYLHYVGYICVGLIYDGTFLGVAQEYLWPTLPWLANKSLVLSLYATNLFVYLFAQTFLNLKRDLPRWNLLFNVLSGLAIGGLLLSLVLSYNAMIIFVPVLSFVGSAASITVAVVSWRRGFKPARYYLAAWTAFFIGIMFFASNKMGIVPHNLLTENAHQLGFALNIVLLSFALADRINTMKADKEQAQAEALQIQQRAAENLEQEVERKTLDLQKRTDELREAYERMAEHDRLKSRFFANVSHEVRTPLALILTPLERLLAGESGDVSPQVKQKLRSMVGNVQRLLRLINQLLDFSRLESGGTTVAFERIDVQRLLASIVESFDPFARSKGVALMLRGPEQLPELWTDPSKLEKVISNLLSNACKFTETGGSVIVRLTTEERAVVISVKDTGIGIPEEDLPHIFERFRQVDGSASRKYEGTGIGLALSKELSQLIGGTLEVESEISAGSTFTVSLPTGKDHIHDPAMIRSEDQINVNIAEGAEITTEMAGTTAAALAAESPLRSETSDPSGATTDEKEDPRPMLLVVEDNPDMRALVSEICQDAFRVVEAADGQEGLMLIQQHRPALVISDIMMPRIDGYELLRRIRSDPATTSIPVILLTAKAGPEMKLEGLESGADDYLTKPFESRELLARAQNLVRLQEQERELRHLTASLQQEVVSQSSALERARSLCRYLPPEMVREVFEEGRATVMEQKRCRLTVFILELPGFDEVMEELEPEDMMAMLNGYLSEVVDLAFSHGATVDKLWRDTVLGFFGAPSSDGPDQDALKCALMAIEMWHLARDICERWTHVLERTSPSPTMVLTSGYATAGNFGSSNRLEYTAVGGPVDEARVLMGQVSPGGVYCTHTTWATIQEHIEGEYLDDQSVGLRSRPVKLYRLAGAETPAKISEPSPLAAMSTQDLRSPDPPRPGTQRPGGRKLHDTSQLEMGSVFAERYEILQRLGSGGMGTVYRARDQKLNIDLALKVFRSELIEDSKCVERLYREVKVARLVNHPGIARIYDLGEWEEVEFITMEYIQGQTLEQLLVTDDALSLSDGMSLLLKLCSALAAAHAAGIVHRDLKPANIMLEPGGRVVILDFGIAKWISDLHHAGTETHGVMGTPYYMAPEQFKGDRVTLQADIYSLGVVIYEIFTGVRPFEADTVPEVAYQHVNDLPSDPLEHNPDLPPRLVAVILRCLEKAPENRFGSVGEITNLLMGVSSTKEVGEVPPSQPSRSPG